MFHMRRSDGKRDTLVYFPNASVARPDANGAVPVIFENVMALMEAGWEIIDQADFERWHRYRMTINQQET